MTARALVAGIGNIFLGDDGFGSAVAQELVRVAPHDVKVEDYGIRGVHLAYELLEGYETLVLVDAVSRGDAPGTLSVIEPATDTAQGDGVLGAMDAHGMNPVAVLQMVGDLGGHIDRVLVVGCEAGCVLDGIGLSPAVECAVPIAVALVQEVLADALASAPASVKEAFS